MRASVHVDLPGYTKEGLPALKKRCEELKVQPRGEHSAPLVFNNFCLVNILLCTKYS
jgi:hypothetical protein